MLESTMQLAFGCFSLSHLAVSQSVCQRQILVKGRVAQGRGRGRSIQRSESDASLHPVFGRPHGRRVASLCNFVSQRFSRIRSRHSPGQRPPLSRECILETVYQKLFQRPIVGPVVYLRTVQQVRVCARFTAACTSAVLMLNSEAICAYGNRSHPEAAIFSATYTSWASGSQSHLILMFANRE